MVRTCQREESSTMSLRYWSHLCRPELG